MKFMIGEDGPYEVDLEHFPVRTARLLKKLTGFGLKSFSDAMQDGDPDALAFVMFLGKRNASEAVTWDDLDDVDLSTFRAVEGVAEEALETPDPTSGALNGETALAPLPVGKIPSLVSEST